MIECLYVQTVPEKKHVYVQTAPNGTYLCADYRAFRVTYVQTIVRSLVFPDRVILYALTPPPPLVRSFRSGHQFSV